MAVVLAVQRWRPYLLGTRFIVRTDQRSLKFLLEQRVIQPQYQRWIAKLLGYAFELVYKPGVENKVADALSRIPSTAQLCSMIAPIFLDLKTIKEEVEEDENLYKIITELLVDRLSKYGHFLPLKHPYSAKSIAELFVKEVVRLHGFTKSIVSDRDKVFLSNFLKEMFRLAGIKLNRSSAYHPHSDGQTEVVNREVEPKEWINWLLWAEYWYNATFRRVLGMTPFQVVYGHKPPSLMLAIRLELSTGSVIHPIFHVSQLKKVVEEHTDAQPTIQQLEENFVWETNLVEAIDYRKNKARGWELMVSWEGLPNHEAT
ncbi:MADS-box transcription factor ANR1 [Cucumis melo var. makuwa]|uniref:MADS-box transcription factor ANR1 n=1 Tax=Cucumis melo var. makuwa TaxID=1194695 RepID=A0A5D3E2V4_CUCMM|nr:MADS-box transcription factor ANR1 [Cucumis melo var. makuwa]TYK30214.1 MADS-box transcription factor ANR1 [Cucumis melo var. makuwa]